MTRDLIERALRQLLQTYGPVIYVVLTSAAAHGTLAALVTALASVVVLTTLKWAAHLRAGADAPTWLALLDRAGSAVAVTLASFGVVDLASLLALDWGKALQAAVVAGVLAVLTYYGLPPAVPPTPDPTPDAEADAGAGEDVAGGSPYLRQTPGRGYRGRS